MSELFLSIKKYYDQFNSWLSEQRSITLVTWIPSINSLLMWRDEENNQMTFPHHLLFDPESGVFLYSQFFVFSFFSWHFSLGEPQAAVRYPHLLILTVGIKVHAGTYWLVQAYIFKVNTIMVRYWRVITLLSQRDFAISSLTMKGTIVCFLMFSG